jgi:hypothetical protein
MTEIFKGLFSNDNFKMQWQGSRKNWFALLYTHSGVSFYTFAK